MVCVGRSDEMNVQKEMWYRSKYGIDQKYLDARRKKKRGKSEKCTESYVTWVCRKLV